MAYPSVWGNNSLYRCFSFRCLTVPRYENSNVRRCDKLSMSDACTSTFLLEWRALLNWILLLEEYCLFGDNYTSWTSEYKIPWHSNPSSSANKPVWHVDTTNPVTGSMTITMPELINAYRLWAGIPAFQWTAYKGPTRRHAAYSLRLLYEIKCALGRPISIWAFGSDPYPIGTMGHEGEWVGNTDVIDQINLGYRNWIFWNQFKYPLDLTDTGVWWRSLADRNHWTEEQILDYENPDPTP